MLKLFLYNTKIRLFTYKYIPGFSKILIQGQLRKTELYFPFILKLKKSFKNTQNLSKFNFNIYKPYIEIEQNLVNIQMTKNKVLNLLNINNTLWQRALCSIFDCNKNHRISLRLIDLNKDGYKVQLINEELILNLGLSHLFKISSLSLEELGSLRISRKQKAFSIKIKSKTQCLQIIDAIRKLRRPEPYKGKGVLLKNENVKRKKVRRAKSSKNFKKRRRVKRKKDIGDFFLSGYSNKRKQRKHLLVHF